MMHCLLLYAIVCLSLGRANVALPSMKTHGLWFVSTVVFSCIVALSTFRLLLEMSNVTVLHHAVLWGSMLVYLLVMFGT
jgi:hypothetical protein